MNHIERAAYSLIRKCGIEEIVAILLQTSVTARQQHFMTGLTNLKEKKTNLHPNGMSQCKEAAY